MKSNWMIFCRLWFFQFISFDLGQTMSDEEEDSSQDSESEENSQDDSSVVDSLSQVNENIKKQQVESDVKLLYDIFEYIDQNTSRITTCSSMTKNFTKPPTPLESTSKNNSATSSRDNRDMNWANYDMLNDVDRAKLLEKAISLLATDEKVF